MSDWLDDLQQIAANGEAAVLVTVAGTRGSTPREVGAKMIVTATETIGTIGGGQLEYLCTQEACQWFGDTGFEFSSGKALLRKFTLGANCGQCCGGVAEILFEAIVPMQTQWVDQLLEYRDGGVAATMVTARQSRTSSVKWLVTSDDCISYGDSLTLDQTLIDHARLTIRTAAGGSRNVAKLASNVELPVLLEPVREKDFRVVIFGAGHVGSTCAAILSTLDARIDLVDNRKGFIGDDLPTNVHAHEALDPATFVAAAAANSYFLIMTHDHGLDFEICTRILQRQDVSFCGLIGSRTKRRRFQKKFRALDISETEIARLTCPIGIDEISGKKPAEIAIAVAAQLQGLHESGIRTGDACSNDELAIVRTKHAIGGRK